MGPESTVNKNQEQGETVSPNQQHIKATEPSVNKKNYLSRPKSATELASTSILVAFLPFVIGLFIAIICDIFGVDMSDTARDVELFILVGISAVLQSVLIVMSIRTGVKQQTNKTYIIFVVIAFFAVISNTNLFIKTLMRLTNNE